QLLRTSQQIPRNREAPSWTPSRPFVPFWPSWGARSRRMEQAKRRAVAATMMARHRYYKVHASVRRTAVAFIAASDLVRKLRSYRRFSGPLGHIRSLFTRQSDVRRAPDVVSFT